MYNLIKKSEPRWYYKATAPEDILDRLDQSVCAACKWKKSYVELVAKQEGWGEEGKRAVLTTALPDNYNTLTAKDKISLLLKTPCGSVFTVE